MPSHLRRQDDTRDLESRVSSVETAVQHIEAGMSEIRSTIREGFVALKGDMDTQAGNSRPQLVAWAGWAGVLLLVIGMFGSGYIRDLSRIEDTVKIQRQAQLDNRLTDSANHSAVEERLRALEREIFPYRVVVQEKETE